MSGKDSIIQMATFVCGVTKSKQQAHQVLALAVPCEQFWNWHNTDEYPYPYPLKTCTLGYGYGFLQVWVWVHPEIPQGYLRHSLPIDVVKGWRHYDNKKNKEL